MLYHYTNRVVWVKENILLDVAATWYTLYNLCTSLIQHRDRKVTVLLFPSSRTETQLNNIAIYSLLG